MRVKTHHVAASLFAGAIFLSTMAWFSVQVPTVLAACSAGAGVFITAPSASATLSGTSPLQAYSSSTTAPTTVTFTISAPTGAVLGNGLPQSSGTSNMNWLLNWDSTTVPNGGYQLTAIAHYGNNTTADCSSTPVAVNVTNTTIVPLVVPTLTANIAPTSWQTLPGGQKNFAASGIYTNQNGNQYPITSTSSGAAFTWDTDAGSLSPNGAPSISLTAGQKTGNLHLGVTVSINGLVQHAVAAIIVTAPSTTGTTSASPTPVPKTSPALTPAPANPSQPKSTSGVGGTPPLTAAETKLLTATVTIFRPATSSNSAPIIAVPILGCLKAKLGTSYTAISSGQTQPSADDRQLSLGCFSGSERIPAILAPVSPSHVTELPEEKAILTIGSIKNQTVANKQGDKVVAILLGGTAAPNSSVFLYFFSDPMVLRAETDSRGQWSYVLQNPLKPGKHEVYAVAAKDSASFVRTSAIPISIAAAAAGSQDGSLVIEPRWQAAQVGYVAGAVLMVLTAIFLMFRLRRRRTPVTLVSAVSAPMVTGVAPALIQPATPVAAPVAAAVQPPPPVTPEPTGHDVQV